MARSIGHLFIRSLGGAGSAVNECLAAHRVLVPVLNLGLPDAFVEHGSRGECLALAGLDRESVLHAVRRWRGSPGLRTAGGT